MNVDETPAGSLSKKSRKGKDADASDDEEPVSSPATSSPVPRSSPPPEDVKEVTTGVKEIELDQKQDVPISDPSEVIEPPTGLTTETSAPADGEVKSSTENPTPEQRSGEEDKPEAEESQDPRKGDTTDETPVKPAQEPIDDSKDTVEATTPSSTDYEDSVTSEDELEVTS